MRSIYQLLFLTLILLISSCAEDEPMPSESCNFDAVQSKGDRLIGLDLLNLTESNSFDLNLSIANDMGIDFIALHLPWNIIETSPQDYVDPFNALQLLSETAVANNYQFSLTIRPIDLTGKTVPSDLESARFNDEAMIERFKELLEFVFSKVTPSVLLNIQIGNEIDGYNTSNEPISFWSDYKDFLRQSTDYIHSFYPDLKVGYTGTFHGLMRDQSRFVDLMDAVDIIGVTYYPINDDFSVKAPDDVFEAFNELTAAFGSKDIYIQEIGYQSSAVNNSSEQKQAEFFCNAFSAWDQHRDIVKSMNLVRLNDLSQSEANSAATPYGITDDRFIEYLRTLGLRSYCGDGTDKPAIQMIKDNMSIRGW